MHDRFVRDLLTPESVKEFSELFLDNLKSLVVACYKPVLPGDVKTIPVLGISPSDFPAARQFMNQQQLDAEFGSHFTEVETVLPLTPLQEGMLFDTLREPHSELYVTQLVSGLSFSSPPAGSGHHILTCRQIYELDNDLDVPGFLRCFDHLISRYSSLRSYFLAESFSAPLQVVLKTPNFPVPQDAYGCTWFSVTALDWSADSSEMVSNCQIRMYLTF